MKVLICGGRDFVGFDKMKSVMDKIDQDNKITWVIHGAARGADSLGGWWAADKGIWVTPYPADWDTHGNRAGPIRNQYMLDHGKPDLVVAFPGGNGTAHMKRIARRAGIQVIEID